MSFNTSWQLLCVYVIAKGVFMFQVCLHCLTLFYDMELKQSGGKSFHIFV